MACEEWKLLACAWLGLAVIVTGFAVGGALAYIGKKESERER